VGKAGQAPASAGQLVDAAGAARPSRQARPRGVLFVFRVERDPGTGPAGRGGVDPGAGQISVCEERFKVPSGRSRRRSKRVLFGAALVVVLALAGCGSSGGSGGGSSSAASNLKGSPLSVFFINAQGSPTGNSYPAETVAAKAAVQYINNELGGIAGHPLTLETCFTDETPAQTTNCANRAVTANPIAISLGILADDNDIIAVTGRTQVPIVANSAFTAQTLVAKDKAFIVDSGGQAAALGNGLMMTENGVKKAAVIYVNVPAVSGGIYPQVAGGLKKAGIDVAPFPVSYPSPDLSPTMEAVRNSGADAILLIADPTTCAAAFNAAQTLGLKNTIYSPIECQNPTNNRIVANLPQKVYVQQTFVDLKSNDTDAEAYTAAMKKYGGSTNLNSGFAVNGFQSIMAVYAGLKAASATGTPTTATLENALRTQKLHQFLLGPSTTFTCDGKLLPALPALCSLNTLIGVWKGETVTDAKVLDAAKLLA